MAGIFKVALLLAGVIFTMLGVENEDKDAKTANITGGFMMFALLWLTLMTM